MIRQGSKTLPLPAITRIAPYHRTSSVALSRLFESRSSTKYRESCIHREYSGLNRIEMKNVRSERGFSSRTKKSPKPIDLKQARQLMNDILAELSTPGSNPVGVQDSELTGSEMDQSGILQRTNNLLNALLASVDKGILRPSGKHGKELSKLLEHVLYVYSHVDLPKRALLDDCKEVLSILRLWNLDLRNKHYDYTVMVANREEHWKEASNLFWKQIDPEAGYSPVNVSISTPNGLYAIARLAQEEDSAVAEHVFDAVRQLTMVSPRDQETYILAAGAALGKAGAWKSAVDFLESSYTASQFGQPLITSVMQACLLSDRPEEALNIFETRVFDPSSIAEEWQWGGERDRMDPLCRDLAMQAMGSREGMSTLALQYFDQVVSEGVTISPEALLGIVEACEQDRNWEGSISVLERVLENLNKTNWIVPGIEMAVTECISHESHDTSSGSVMVALFPELDKILASVMRVCNLTSKFGLALFCLRLTELSVPSTKEEEKEVRMDIDPSSLMESTLYATLLKFSDPDELLVPTMVSLCGLRCSQHAIHLFEKSQKSVENGNNGREMLSEASMVYEYALAENSRNNTLVLGNQFLNAYKHLHKITAAVHLVNRSNRDLTGSERDLIINALSTAMNSCTSAHQPSLSLLLLNWVERNIRGHSSTNHQSDTTDDFVLSSDSLFAELITAHRWSKNVALSMDLFQSLLDTKVTELNKWKLSVNAGLSALVDNDRGMEAVEIFKAMDNSALTTESYTIIARFLAKKRNSKELIELYRFSVEQGHLSDEMGLLTMAAVVSSRIDNRLRVLRAMVEENAKSVNIDPVRWMRSRYWHVKRALGFDYARLLMWWNDPETCHLDELELAIEDFYQQRKTRLKAKNDVVRLIVSSAKAFNEDLLPDDKSKWPKAPFSKKDWVVLLQEVLDEVQSSAIMYDTSFIDDVVTSWLNLGCNHECVLFTKDTLNKGINFNRQGLMKALQAANAEHSLDLIHDIKMLIQQSSSESAE